MFYFILLQLCFYVQKCCNYLAGSCRAIVGSTARNFYYILLHIKPQLQWNKWCNKIKPNIYFIAAFILFYSTYSHI